MAIGTVQAIAEAVKEVSRVIGNWQVSREKNRMQAAIESGERYILVSEKDGEYKDISEERRKQLLRHFRKRFFAYNQ